MRPIPATRLGDAHGLIRAIEQRGRLRMDEFVTQFSLDQLFPPDLENALGRMRHFISYARSAGLVKEDRGMVELTDLGRRYIRSGDPAAFYDVSPHQAEWLRRQLREKHMTDSIFHGLAIGLSLLASVPPGAQVATLDFGRSMAYLGRAGWDNDNTLQIQGERHLTLLRDMELIDEDRRLTSTGEQVRSELTLPIHMSLIDLAGQLNPGGPPAVREAAAVEFDGGGPAEPEAQPSPSVSEASPPAAAEEADDNGYQTAIGLGAATPAERPRPPVVPRPAGPPPSAGSPYDSPTEISPPVRPEPAASASASAAPPVAPPARSGPPPVAVEPPAGAPPPGVAPPSSAPPAAGALSPAAEPGPAPPGPPDSPASPPAAGPPPAAAAAPVPAGVGAPGGGPPPAAAASPPVAASPVAAPPAVTVPPDVAPSGAARRPGAPGGMVAAAAIRAAAEESGLELPTGVYANLAAALAAGRHVLLTGPPGAGKTTLALAAARAAAQQGRAQGATLLAAGSDGDAVERIVEAAGGGRWIVLDELDRVDPDALLGSLSAFLGGLPVARAGGDEVAPPADWRVVATSRSSAPRAAILRRFAVVEVARPVTDVLEALLRAAACGDETAAAAAERLLPLAEVTPLGAGVFLDAARHAAARNAAAPTDVATLAHDAYVAYVAPLLREPDAAAGLPELRPGA